MMFAVEELEDKIKEKGNLESKDQKGKMERLDSLLSGQGKLDGDIKQLGIYSLSYTQAIFTIRELNMAIFWKNSL